MTRNLLTTLALLCATSSARAQAEEGPRSPWPDETDAAVADTTEPALRADGWPPYFELELLKEVTGTVQGGPRNRKIVYFPAGYILHRDDVEKISISKGKLDRCVTERTDLEEREAERVADPPFLDSDVGRLLLVGIGLVGGSAVTGLIVLAATGNLNL